MLANFFSVADFVLVTLVIIVIFVTSTRPSWNTSQCIHHNVRCRPTLSRAWKVQQIRGIKCLSARSCMYRVVKKLSRYKRYLYYPLRIFPAKYIHISKMNFTVVICAQEFSLFWPFLTIFAVSHLNEHICMHTYVYV